VGDQGSYCGNLRKKGRNMSDNNVTLESPAETVERCKATSADWYGDKIEFGFLDKKATTSRTMFYGLCERHGYASHIPKEPRPEALLYSAATARKLKGYLIAKFVSPNKDTPLAIGINRMRGHDESGDEIDCRARLRLSVRHNPATGLDERYAVARPPEGKAVFEDELARDRAMAIASAANERMHVLINREAAGMLRTILDKTGCAKSLGGGNNYYVSTGVAPELHDFLVDLTKNITGFHYERNPRTSQGATHTRAVMGQAVKASLTSGIDDLKKALQARIAASVREFTRSNGTKGVKKQTASLEFNLDEVRAFGAKMQAFQCCLDVGVLKQMNDVRELYSSHLKTLLDGGEVKLDEPTTTTQKNDSDDDDEAPKPRTVDTTGEPIEVAASADDDIENLFNF